jgi:predicted RNase H-like HicB family nuclease
VNKQRQVLLYPGEDGLWVVECPSLPGCLSQGATKAEALNNIREAIDLYIESLRADGLPVPEDRFQAELVAVLADSHPSPVRSASRLCSEPGLPSTGSMAAMSF